MRFNDLFWRCGCYRYDGVFENKRDINIPVFLKNNNKRAFLCL